MQSSKKPVLKHWLYFLECLVIASPLLLGLFLFGNKKSAGKPL